MFWLIYQDLDNLGKPWFMHALGLITVAFAFFWLLIPMVVVWTRRRSRVRRNRERHAKWLAEGGTSGVSPHPAGRGNSEPRVHRKGRADILPREGDALHIPRRAAVRRLRRAEQTRTRQRRRVPALQAEVQRRPAHALLLHRPRPRLRGQGAGLRRSVFRTEVFRRRAGRNHLRGGPRHICRALRVHIPESTCRG